jgi:hypothetical protein
MCLWVAQTIQRELACWNHKWRQCSSLSLISRVLLTLNSFHKPANQACYVEILKHLDEVMCRKGPELWPNNCIFHHDNALSSSIWSKNWFLKWCTHPISQIWFWITSVSKNEVCPEGTKISGDTEDIKKMWWWWYWKLFHNGSSKHVSNNGSNTGLSA